MGRLRSATLAAAAAAAALGAASAQAPPSPTRNSLGMTMVPVPSGRFTMGSPPGARMRQEEERPHDVTLTKAFRISATEVTRGQWAALMPATAASTTGEDLPVASVSWAEAREFCRRLSQKERTPYRLPTEAEWEYACRAGETAGATALDAMAWYADNSDGAAHAVATRRPNAWGLYDMLGNVAEWTADVYAPYAPGSPQTDPTGPRAGTTRVLRGGSWRSFPPALRCEARTGSPESYQLPHLGFRVVSVQPGE